MNCVSVVVQFIFGTRVDLSSNPNRKAFTLY